ncbi:LPXTG cell wall anchor domain-containing protein [Streptomyces sp. NPDC002793]|uniref:LPXTG cell wall anchor domain-containing protein n=1 Tax=Streptomyces sp. NPDC002793 TaxID=3154432 RepID=UPI0033292BAE
MLIFPHIRRTSRTAVAALGAAGLLALGATPAAADEAAAELVVGDIAPIDGVQPGSSFDQPVTVANKGTKAADKAWVVHSVTRGLDYADIPSNCQAYEVPSYDEMTAKSNVVCAFDQALEPGVAYTPEKPLAVKVLDRALEDDLRVSVWDTEPAPDDAATPPVAGTAPAVALVEQPDGGEATEDAVDVSVSTVNTADYQVTGADLKGRVGDTVTLKAKFTNAGPAWTLTREGDPLVEVRITPPAGTSVVKPHGYCEAEGEAYVCGTGQRWVHEGGGETYTFQLKIDKKVEGAVGSVALSTEARPFDPDKGNDRADITLDVTDGGSAGTTAGSTASTGSTGSTGSAGGSPAGGDDGGTSSTGAGSSSSTTTGGNGASTTGGAGSSTTGGSLAATGSSSTTLALGGAAAAAVAVGAGTLIAVRRRRAQGLG